MLSDCLQSGLSGKASKLLSSGLSSLPVSFPSLFAAFCSLPDPAGNVRRLTSAMCHLIL